MNHRQAALALAVDPLGLGGACLRGGHGPAREAWLNLLRAVWPAPSPWLRLPLHADEHRLYGGLDLAATLQLARPVLQPGVLAQADGGCLLVASAERLAPGRVAALASVLDRHVVPVARDGLVAESPARVALIAFDESMADEAPLAAALTDRLAFCLTLDAIDPTMSDDPGGCPDPERLRGAGRHLDRLEEHPCRGEAHLRARVFRGAADHEQGHAPDQDQISCRGNDEAPGLLEYEVARHRERHQPDGARPGNGAHVRGAGR